MMRRDYSHLYPSLDPPSQIAALRADMRDLRHEILRRFTMLDADLKDAVDAITETTSAMKSLEMGVSLIVGELHTSHDAKMLALQNQIAALQEQLSVGRPVAPSDLSELQTKTGELRVANKRLGEVVQMLQDAIPAGTMAPPAPAPEPVLVDPPIDPPPAPVVDPAPAPAPVAVVDPAPIPVDPAPVVDPPIDPPPPSDPLGR